LHAIKAEAVPAVASVPKVTIAAIEALARNLVIGFIYSPNL
jgi:hypothetical protein